jgi:hypothetical protein
MRGMSSREATRRALVRIRIASLAVAVAGAALQAQQADRARALDARDTYLARLEHAERHLPFPETFRVGVSVAPVPEQRLYDTIYQERYVGLPQSNAKGYRIGSPINFAEGLRGSCSSCTGRATTTCTTREPRSW